MRSAILLLFLTASARADGVTHHISPEFEVQDGLGVTYARVGRSRVVRMVSTGLAAKMYPDAVPDGKITAGDVWVAGSTAPVERMLLSSARRALYEVLPEVTWLAADPLGSITVETDDQGAVVGRRSYATFGQVRAQAGDADRYGFTGQEMDASGTMHFSFRQLDAATGRWASEDPLFGAASPEGIGRLGEATTAYAYVGGNTANYFDPTGLGKNPATTKQLDKSQKKAADKIQNSKSPQSVKNQKLEQLSARTEEKREVIQEQEKARDAAGFGTFLKANASSLGITAEHDLKRNGFGTFVYDNQFGSLNDTHLHLIDHGEEGVHLVVTFTVGAQKDHLFGLGDKEQVNLLHDTPEAIEEKITNHQKSGSVHNLEQYVNWSYSIAGAYQEFRSQQE